MSVEARDVMSHEWTRWQGQLVGVYPLGRCLGHSEHSGVFLTKARSEDHRQLAIKLLPASRAQEELQLPRWARAAALPHPHLLPLLEWGACQLDGMPYLYVVMEYADQTLAQLLLQRALSADEAREMLKPILNAFAFLHAQDLVHGQLKPANVLVVGDQLKLASDTLCQRGDPSLSAGASAYDPPEGRDNRSAAGDIWALGVSLFAALTRRTPSASQSRNLALPADFPLEWREVVSRCLSHKPVDRPDAAALLAWSEGRGLKSAPEPPRAPVTRQPEPPTARPAPVVPSRAAPAAPRSAPPKAPNTKPRPLVIAALAAGLIVVLIGTGRILTAHRTVDAPEAPAAEPAAPSAAAAPPEAPKPSAAAQQFALHQVIPDVARSAARTIRGHVKVAVRAIVAADGSVSAVVADRGGPSKYFQRLALDAAKRWTFPAGPARRLVEIQFDFSRDGTTARAAPAP